MAPYNSNFIEVYSNEIDTYPRSSAVTGTVTSDNDGRDIYGTGTLFASEFQLGEYLFIAAKSEVRRISYISSDTKMTLDEPFTGAALAGATPLRAPRPNNRQIIIEIDSTGTAEISGKELLAGSKVPFQPSGGVTGGRQYQVPVVIDTTTNSNIAQVYATK